MEPDDFPVPGFHIAFAFVDFLSLFGYIFKFSTFSALAQGGAG